MKATPFLMITLFLLSIRSADKLAEEIKAKVERHNKPSSDLLDEMGISTQNSTLELESQLRSMLKRVEGVVDMTFSAIDEQTLRNAWREGLGVEKDLTFENDVTYYRLKDIYDFPCKSINFLFGIKNSFDIYSFNTRRYILCFLKFYDKPIKEYLSDIVVKGSINILKSGTSNPVSTFFTNLLIIEGPLKLKEELFGALYKYVEENMELNRSFEMVIDKLVKLTFDDKLYETEVSEFIEFHSTSIVFFFYEMIITYLENKQIYMSAYDFIQPDNNLMSNPASLDPKYVTDRYSEILLQDLNRFKEIRDTYQKKSSSTVYHQTYAGYVDKNIQLLCKIIYSIEDC